MSRRPTRSFLLSTTSAPRPEASISPARRASSAVAASRASTTSTATSQRSTWSRAIAADTCSTRVSIERRRRMPAVSTSTYSRPPNEKAVSIGSRVVPGASCTSTRSSPSRQLTSDDLPTFGFPMKAMRMGRFSSSRRGGGAARTAADAASLGRRATTASRNWLTPRPWLAETGNTSSKPNENASAARRGAHAFAVDLVRGDQHRLAGLAEQLRDLAVDGGHALARVDDERHDVGLVQRAQRLLPHRREDPGRERIEAAGVDDAKPRRPPLADAVAAIARDARLVLDQRRLPADQAVEQRRLADVRPPDQRDQRKRFVLGAGAHGAVYP